MTTNELIYIKQFEDLPKVLEFSLEDVSGLDAIITPILLKAQLWNKIHLMPKEAWNDINGLKIFYTLFSLYEIVDEYIKLNLKWDSEDEEGLKATKSLLKCIRKDLESKLKLTIPERTIFKSVKNA